MKQKDTKIIALVVLVLTLALVVGYLAVTHNSAISLFAPTPSPTPTVTPPPIIDHGGITLASLGHEFILKKSEVAKLSDANGLEIEIIQFFNSPCPADVQCFWSGVGVSFEMRLNGQVQKGMDALEAFGFHAVVVKTDYETYATFLVERMSR